MKKILIIEKGISENFIFYLKLTARELLDLINYRKYVSSQQKVQSFGFSNIGEWKYLTSTFVFKGKPCFKELFKLYSKKKAPNFPIMNIECNCTYESKYSTKL